MNLDPALLDILACPNCRAELRADDDAVAALRDEVLALVRG